MRIHNEKLLESFGKDGRPCVAFVSDAFYPLVGGATTVVDNAAKALMEKVNVVVIAPDGDYEDKSEYPVIRCKAIKISNAIGSLAFPGLDRKFRKLVNNLKFDIVHCHSIFSLAKYFQKLAKKKNIPFVMAGHSKFNEEFSKIIKPRLIRKIMVSKAVAHLNRSDEVWPVSAGCEKVYKEIGVKVPTKVFRNATSLEYPHDSQELVEFVNKKYDLKDKKNVLLFLSRLDYKTKNIDYIIRSCALLQQENFDFFLVLTGGGPDEKYLQNMVEKYGLQNKVLFTGMVTDLNEKMGLYLRSDLFVFPSVVDNGPLVIREAAAMKTPSVLIENSCSAEGAVDEKNAYLCELSDEAIAKKIKEALSSKETYDKVCEQAQKDLGGTWKKTAEAYIKRYLELIAKKSGK